MKNDFIEGDEWDAYVALDTFSTNGTRDGLTGASPRSRSLRSSPRCGRAHHMAKGDRWSDDPDVKVREMRNAETVLGVIA